MIFGMRVVDLDQPGIVGQGQTLRIVYALPFEPVVGSRSILGLSLLSSANGNCECPLPVHLNCLFFSNHGAFNVLCVSGRSALIYGSVSPCKLCDLQKVHRVGSSGYGLKDRYSSIYGENNMPQTQKTAIFSNEIFRALQQNITHLTNTPTLVAVISVLDRKLS